MAFRVELSDLASSQYDEILGYIYFRLKNPQTDEDVMGDFEDMVEVLEERTSQFGFCEVRG